MKKFDNVYFFYKLKACQRRHMIDQTFETEDHPNCLFFPIGLTKEGSYNNYLRMQGIIAVSPIWPSRIKKGEFWMKVFAISPDDLDADLEFQNPTTEFRERIISFLKGISKRNTTYDEILEKVHKQFGGELYL